MRIKHFSGFSSLELIIFLSIIGILLFLSVPFIRSIPFTKYNLTGRSNVNSNNIYDSNVAPKDSLFIESNNSNTSKISE